MNFYLRENPNLTVGGRLSENLIRENGSSKMTGKIANSGNNHIDVMDNDAELRLRLGTSCLKESVTRVLGWSGDFLGGPIG